MVSLLSPFFRSKTKLFRRGEVCWFCLPGLLGRANLIKSHAGWIHLQCSAATRAGDDGETPVLRGKNLKRSLFLCVILSMLVSQGLEMQEMLAFQYIYIYIHHGKLWAATVRSCWIQVVYINVLYCVKTLLLSVLLCMTVLTGDVVFGNHPSNNSYRKQTTRIETAYSRVFFDLFWGRWNTSLKFNIDTIQQPTFNRRYLFQSSMFGTQVEFPD